MTTCCSSEDTVREAVRRRYARVAQGETPPAAERVASAVGYEERERQAVPEGANLGLGCGAPLAALGAAAGRDGARSRLGRRASTPSSRRAAVGPSGRVIGVDMTPEMLAKARGERAQGGHRQRRVPPGHARGAAGRGRVGRRR